jgi:hypothetical protein
MVVDAAEVTCKTGNCLLGRAAIRGKLIQVDLFQLFLTERRQPLPIPFVRAHSRHSLKAMPSD